MHHVWHTLLVCYIFHLLGKSLREMPHKFVYISGIKNQQFMKTQLVLLSAIIRSGVISALRVWMKFPLKLNMLTPLGCISWQWLEQSCLLGLLFVMQFLEHVFFFSSVRISWNICGKAFNPLTTTKMVLDARAGPHAASINWLSCKPLKCLLLESVQPHNRVATGTFLLYLLVEWWVVHLCRNSSAIIGGGHGLLKGCQIACSSHTYAFMCPCSVFL